MSIHLTPNRLPWPPMIFVGVCAFALLLEALAPLRYDGPAWLTQAGWALGAAAFALIGWSAWTMRRFKTNILPHRAADRIVRSGPFAFSRNPIYLGTTTLLVAAALVRAEPWFLFAAALDAVLVARLAIRREEEHLAARFPEEWPAYRSAVPRWIGPF
ncbi:MAG: isoprenylcysteine carboxylmethyltransferase family protein [Alphaproteobacteria bacterium]|nr:isoprenylcysteine carboxylmethyltransferase family protein [Alphaproteobacteria bacterium]